MRQTHADFEGAIAWVVKYHSELETQFIEGLKTVPSWGDDLDCGVQLYLRGLANWPRANDCWNFESGRYFGSKGLEVQQTRLIPKLPKVEHGKSDSPGGTCVSRERVVVPLVEELEAIQSPDILEPSCLHAILPGET